VVVRLKKTTSPTSSLSREGEMAPARWTCSLVNNMPDAAFSQTERQYLGLLDAGSGEDVVDVVRHSMIGVPRGAEIAAKIAAEYSPMDQIRTRPPNLLIVTGSNPIETRIEDEPYWGEMVNLLVDAKKSVQSMLLSCLAAHAALTIFDNLKREHLAIKQTGVFTQDVHHNHRLTDGIDDVIRLPHSRMNTVPTALLSDTGYQILIESDDVGWGVASKHTENADIVLIQGHPEYDPSSLLREYRRDAGRYLRHERDEMPVLPFQCVAPDDWAELESMHTLISTDRNSSTVFDAYPFDEVGDRAPWLWRRMAEQLYKNWFTGLASTST